MKQMKTIDAVGQILCHDITQILPGEFKGVKFKKGHLIKEEDIPVLLSIGKEHLYIWEKDDTKYHENEAAQILYELCAGEHMNPSEVKEGKIELIASVDGLLKINVELLEKINSLGEMMIASRHPNTPVQKGDKICGTRVIPLVIEKDKMEQAEAVCGEQKIFHIMPFKQKKIGIVTTGSEVFHGRIEDKFGPVLIQKVKEYGAVVTGQTITDDSSANIEQAIMEFLDQGVDMVLCSGGMSVDPDDCTPLAIKNTGASIVSYGAPVLPGAMFLLAYYNIPLNDYNGDFPNGKIPIVGLPGCVMYAKRTIFDLVLPRLMADDPVTKEDLAKLGKGGLCLNCEPCTYPNCGFGKGW